MPKTLEYAKEKNVGIYLWVNWKPLYNNLEEAFTLYEKWGVKGLMVDFLNRDDQEMICIQEEILKCAAKHKLFIQFHGSSKPSGLNRTFPNEFTREGTLNYENCKVNGRCTADHIISIPFTRMLAGPTDFHLGGFRALPNDKFKIQYRNPYVLNTRCHMLALYIVLENHLISLCDSPSAYINQTGFEVLQSVPGTWDEIHVPEAKFNEYVVIARKKGHDWWIGALNNGIARTINLTLDFIDNNAYNCIHFSDGNNVKNDANDVNKRIMTIKKNDIIKLDLASNGGAVIKLEALQDND